MLNKYVLKEGQTATFYQRKVGEGMRCCKEKENSNMKRRCPAQYRSTGASSSLTGKSGARNATLCMLSRGYINS